MPDLIKSTRKQKSLDFTDRMKVILRAKQRMPSRLHDLSVNQALSILLGFLRLLLWGAIILNLTVESLEVLIAKDIHHLALFTILILFTNLQLGISRLLLSMNDDARAKKLLIMAILMLSAAFLQIVDLGLDQLLIYLSKGSKNQIFQIISLLEFLFGASTTLIAGYSMDRFFILLKSKANQLGSVKI